ncbi:MAG: sugar kinase [Firmicutes bacterium]|nr:sugar kinase [Bacillota bacterium]
MLDAISIGEPLVGIYGVSGKGLQAETDFRRVLGGDTSNFSLALTKLGHPTGYVTRLGADPFGEAYLAMWQEAGVDTSQVKIDRLHPTGLYFTAASDQSHDFVYYRRGSAASHLAGHDIDEDYIRNAKVLHVSGISQAISESCQQAVLEGLEFAKRHGLLISYDFNFRPALWDAVQARKVALHTIGEFATIVCLTKDEIGLLGGGNDYLEIARGFVRQGVDLVAVKLGARGCHLINKTQSVLAPAYPIEVVDTVGAGDAFAAAIVAGTLESMPPRRLAYFANLVAALTCRGTGPVQMQPQREEVNTLLKTV